MGHTIWVEVQGRPLKETADDSSIMHHLMDNLDELAGRLRVAKLSGFYDYSELEEAYADLVESDAEEGSEGGGELNREPTLEERQARGDWFDSAEGLESVRKLRQHLANHFKDLQFTPDDSTGHWPKQLMSELARSEAILEEAVERGRRFRLLIVP
jgi:hypothetical protein